MLTAGVKVETVEHMLGGPVLHYHSKNLVKYPEEGGVWNWHQDYGAGDRFVFGGFRPQNVITDSS